MKKSFNYLIAFSAVLFALSGCSNFLQGSDLKNQVSHTVDISNIKSDTDSPVLSGVRVAKSDNGNAGYYYNSGVYDKNDRTSGYMKDLAAHPLDYHTAKIYVECSTFEKTSAVKYVEVTQTLIDTVQPDVKIENLSPVVTKEGVGVAPVKQGNTSFSFVMNLSSDLPDGIVKLDFKVVDYFENSSFESVSYYVNKDTSIVKSVLSVTNSLDSDILTISGFSQDTWWDFGNQKTVYDNTKKAFYYFDSNSEDKKIKTVVLKPEDDSIQAETKNVNFLAEVKDLDLNYDGHTFEFIEQDSAGNKSETTLVLPCLFPPVLNKKSAGDVVKVFFDSSDFSQCIKCTVNDGTDDIADVSRNNAQFEIPGTKIADAIITSTYSGYNSGTALTLKASAPVKDLLDGCFDSDAAESDDITLPAFTIECEKDRYSAKLKVAFTDSNLSLHTNPDLTKSFVDYDKVLMTVEHPYVKGYRGTEAPVSDSTVFSFLVDNMTLEEGKTFFTTDIRYCGVSAVDNHTPVDDESQVTDDQKTKVYLSFFKDDKVKKSAAADFVIKEDMLYPEITPCKNARYYGNSNNELIDDNTQKLTHPAYSSYLASQRQISYYYVPVEYENLSKTEILSFPSYERAYSNTTYGVRLLPLYGLAPGSYRIYAKHTDSNNNSVVEEVLQVNDINRITDLTQAELVREGSSWTAHCKTIDAIDSMIFTCLSNYGTQTTWRVYRQTGAQYWTKEETPEGSTDIVWTELGTGFSVVFTQNDGVYFKTNGNSVNNVLTLQLVDDSGFYSVPYVFPLGNIYSDRNCYIDISSGTSFVSVNSDKPSVIKVVSSMTDFGDNTSYWEMFGEEINTKYCKVPKEGDSSYEDFLNQGFANNYYQYSIQKIQDNHYYTALVYDFSGKCHMTKIYQKGN